MTYLKKNANFLKKRLTRQKIFELIKSDNRRKGKAHSYQLQAKPKKKESQNDSLKLGQISKIMANKKQKKDKQNEKQTNDNGHNGTCQCSKKRA